MSNKKLKLKISPSWFSMDYVVLKYSTNGIFWKTLKCCTYDILEEWYYFKNYTFHFTNTPSMISKFKTIEDIKAYEKKEEDQMHKYNNSILEARRKKNKERDTIYKQYS